MALPSQLTAGNPQDISRAPIFLAPIAFNRSFSKIAAALPYIYFSYSDSLTLEIEPKRPLASFKLHSVNLPPLNHPSNDPPGDPSSD